MRILLCVLVALAVLGCQRATVKETYEQTPARAASVGEQVTEQWVWRGDRWVCLEQAAEPVPPVASPFVVAPVGENQMALRIQTPARTEYSGEGKKITREVDHFRIVTPFGVSPGETISKQTPMVVQQGETPGIAINPFGVGATEGGASKFTGGGGKWSWWDTLKVRLHDWALGVGGILLILAVGGAALWFLVPAAKPVISGILRAIAAVFPILGSLIESGIGRIREAAAVKPLVETVTGGQRFKDAIDARTDLAPEQKASIRDLFNASMQAEQDGSSQEKVKAIKATL